MNPLAQVKVEGEHGTAIVARLVGEVDLSNVDEIRADLVEMVDHDTETLILDLTDTKYLDSTGVRLLFELAERLQGRRQQLRLVVADGALVRRVVVLTQLDQRVPLDPTVEAALSAVQ
jgi:stage II sporulation protein AA (anti-sigma F factor antagonist)